MALISHFLSCGCGREAGEVKQVGTLPGLQPLCRLCRCRSVYFHIWMFARFWGLHRCLCGLAARLLELAQLKGLGQAPPL